MIVTIIDTYSKIILHRWDTEKLESCGIKPRLAKRLIQISKIGAREAIVSSGGKTVEVIR